MNSPRDLSYIRLVGRRAPVPPLVQRAGRIYPAAIEPASPGARPADVLRLKPGRPALDPGLRAAGGRHLAELRDASRIHDGAVVVFESRQDGVLVCREGGYFDMLATTDVLRVEYLESDSGDHLPLRDRALAAAGGAPLMSGAGRAAAVGLTILLTLPGAGGREVLIGRRHHDLGADPGLWHLAPSGIVEPHPRPLLDTVAGELREELGLGPLDEGRLTLLGIGWDLLRLRPEVCLRLDLEPGELEEHGAALAPEEFMECARIPLSGDGMDDFWRRHPPGELTPAAAAALALAEAPDRLTGRLR